MRSTEFDGSAFFNIAMAYESRGNKRYYYRKKRKGSHVLSEYVGSGELADALSKLDALEQQQREIENEKQRLQRAEIEGVDDEIDAACDLNRAVVDALFLTLGFHKHKRQWRRKKN
jgi:hypothetical protein